MKHETANVLLQLHWPTKEFPRCEIFRLENIQEIIPENQMFPKATYFLKEKSMLSENQRKIFADFHKSVEDEGIFDEKTSHMIKVAAAMAFGCYPWVEQLLGVAREKGISDDEIGAMQFHVMMFSAGRVMMQVDDVTG